MGLAFVKKEIELRENLVGTGFNEPPDSKKNYTERIYVSGEILDCEGF